MASELELLDDRSVLGASAGNCFGGCRRLGASGTAMMGGARELGWDGDLDLAAACDTCDAVPTPASGATG